MGENRCSHGAKKRLEVYTLKNNYQRGKHATIYSLLDDTLRLRTWGC